MQDLDRMMDDIGKMNSNDSGGGMGGYNNVIKNKGINWKMLVFALIMSVVAWGIDFLLYNALKEALPRPLLIGIVFAVLTLLLSPVLVIFGQDSGNDVQPAVQIIGAVGGTVAMLLLAALLQFIYQISLKKAVLEPTSYIFVIDNSGSMRESDPTGRRYDCIEEILRDKEDSFPYMIYGFADEPYIMREMAPKSEGMEPVESEDYGGTSISGTLTQVINDYDNGVWDGGAAPRVILLTDGYATDIILGWELNDTLKRFAGKGISVSCVGLGEVDRELMEKIASETEGVFIDVADVSQLSEAMKSAATQHKDVDRDLISKRNSGNGILYGIMRIAFLVILGGVLGLIKYIAYGDRDSFGKLVLITLGASLVGALLMEVGTNIGLPAAVLWLILWVLYSISLADKNIYVQADISHTGSWANTQNMDDIMSL